MKFHDIVDRLSDTRAARLFLRPPVIPFSVGFCSGHLCLAETGRVPGGGPYLKAFADAPLPGRDRTPTLTDSNLESPGAVAARLDALVRQAGVDLNWCNLLLPDRAARVSILPDEVTASRRSEQDEHLRWRLRKTLPYPVEEARLDWTSLPDIDGVPAQILVVAVRERVLRRYEEVVEALGARVGAVSLESFAVFDLCAPQAPGADWAVLEVSRDGFVLLAARRGRPIFYRCKSYHMPPDDPEAALEGELVPSMEYYRGKLGGGGLARVYLCGPMALEPGIRGCVERCTGTEATPADPSPLVTVPDDLGLGAPDRLWLAPCLGPSVGDSP